MKRKHKSYSKPKRPFDKTRIEEESRIKQEYGLKNKKEIWKAESRIKLIREKAKKLISSPEQDQKALFEKLNKLGIKVKSIGDVLSLEKKDYLDRRLQTIVFKKRIATTPKQARQLITHRKIIVNNSVMDSPSYLVPIEKENKIKIIKNEKTRKNR